MAVLAQKPPMGWNSWNTFGAHINEQLIMKWRILWWQKATRRLDMSM